MSIRRFLSYVSIMLSLFVAGCAIVPGPKGAGRGDVATGVTLALISVAPSEGATDPVALEAVRRVLVGQGYRVGDRGELIADVSFALRERAVGFVGTSGGNSDEGQIQSLPRKADALALCHSRIGRMTISIMDQTSKRLVFRGTAEDLFCDRPDESKLLLLASVALRDIRGGVAVR